MNSHRLHRLFIVIGAALLTVSVPSDLLAQSKNGKKVKVNKEEASETSSSEETQDLALPVITEGPPMTLAQALNAVDSRNLSLKAARVELETADIRLSQATAAVMPMISGDMTFIHHDHEDKFEMGEIPGLGDLGTSVVMPQHNLKATLNVGVPLVHPQSWFHIKVAKKGKNLTHATIEEIRQQLLKTVAESYYYALMAHQVIELHESAIETYTQHVTVAKAKLAAGAGLKIDVIRAETDRDQAYQQLLSAHLALDNARDTLRLLTGGAKDLPMPVESGPMAAPEGEEDALVQKAIENRSDLKTKRSAMAMAQTDLDASWMQLVPTLDANFQGSYQFTETGDMGSNDRSRWLIMLKLSIPIYNQFRYADLDAKRAQIKKARYQQEDAELNASNAVRQGRRNYLTSLASVEIAKRQADMGREALSLVQAAYEAGTGSSLEVTDARRTALSTDIALATKRLEAQIALLSLLYAIGEDMSGLGK